MPKNRNSCRESIINRLNEKQIKSIVESGLLLRYTNNVSRTLLMKYQTVITKHESMFPHNEYLLTLIKKNKSCLPFFSSQPYWKRSLLKMIKKNDNKSIRTTLIERIESNPEFSNEEQAVIMRFWAQLSHDQLRFI